LKDILVEWNQIRFGWMDGWISLAGPEVLRRKDGHGPRGIFLRTRMAMAVAVAVAESALLTYDMIDKDVELVLYLC
jgi:hypothetical protein